jgi:hypothetical protein
MRSTFNNDDTALALDDAAQLLRRVLTEVPRAALPPETRERITHLLLELHEASILAASEVSLESQHPHLRVVTLTPGQYLVLERALQSPRLASSFADLHDFLLASARGYPYTPPPDLARLDASLGHIRRAVVFRFDELRELEPRAAAVGAPSVDVLVVGCTFHWLRVLQERWPNDDLLNTQETHIKNT